MFPEDIYQNLCLDFFLAKENKSEKGILWLESIPIYPHCNNSFFIFLLNLFYEAMNRNNFD